MCEFPFYQARARSLSEPILHIGRLSSTPFRSLRVSYLLPVHWSRRWSVLALFRVAGKTPNKW